MSGYIDGNLAAPFLVSNVVSYPLADKPNNANVKAFTLTYWQWANTYTEANVASTDNNAPNAYLYEQGPLEPVACNVVKFTRSYIQQPFTWYDCEQVVYNYPGLDSNVGTNTWVAFGLRYAVTVPKLATVKHEYFINANIPSANVSPVTIVTLRGQPIDRIGQGSFIDPLLTVPNTDPNVWVISSDPIRFRGSLWEITTKTVGFANVFYP